MPTYDLLTNVELDNISKLVSKLPLQIRLKLQCTSCRYHYDQVYMDSQELHDLSHGRNSAHLVLKCKDCKRDITGNFEPLPKGMETSDDERFCAEITDDNHLLAKITIRGGDMQSFEVISPFSAFAANTTDRFDIEKLDEDGFYDVDKNYDPVSVVLISFETK